MSHWVVEHEIAECARLDTYDVAFAYSVSGPTMYLLKTLLEPRLWLGYMGNTNDLLAFP